MSTGAPKQWPFLLAGGIALLCAPGVLIAERCGWSERPFHLAQWVATLFCFAGSLTFLVSTRGKSLGRERSLAAAAFLLSGLWMAFVCYTLLALDLSAMD